ncbi:MAG: HNH endonuclease [Bellilinea sp.]
MIREPLSKKMRFDVFKRDGFQCQYCGSTPPSVVLEVDHIHPVSKGGKNRTDNLITSCFECNRGKAAGLLDVAPQSVADKTIVIAEKMAQLKAFERLQRAKRKAEEQSIDEVEDVFSSHFEGFTFKDRFRESVRIFLQKMTVYEVMDAMTRACGKVGEKEGALRYFCGTCWKIIGGQK